MSSNDFNGPYEPAEGRGADDYSGNAQGEGAQGAGRDGTGNRGGYARGNGNGRAPAAGKYPDPEGAGKYPDPEGAGKYPDPEGWANDGFWRDRSIDSDYETGLTGAVRPDGADRPAPGNGGYSYWADGKGWENSPGKGAARGGPGADATGYATRADSYATRADYGAGFGAAGGAGAGGDPTAFYGAGGDPTAAYGADGDPTAAYGAGPGRGGRGGRGGPGRPGGPGGPGRNGRKGKGNWWRRWTWKRTFALIGATFALIILAAVGAYYYEYNSTQIPTALAANVLDQTTVVYYSDGKTVIGTIGTVNRHILSYDQIPMRVQDAVVAAEDRGFWTEGGISPTGILRAAYDNLTSSGSSLSGGSTITQQFVRNYYNNIGTSQTATRKIKEIFVAMKVAKAKSKQWILTNYLNMIYLGDNSYGIAAAAQTYFGVPVSKLTKAQAAVIAAVIQQPSNYPQPQYRSRLIARWHYVLNGMVKMGDLTQAQADTMSFPKLLTDQQSAGAQQAYGTTSSSDPWAPYIMNVVYNELTGIDHVSTSQLENGGLKIVTTISRPMEVELYKAVDENIAQIKNTPGATVTTLPPWVMIGAELQNPNNGEMIAMYPGRGQNMSAKQCHIYNCDVNTAVYARELVGSSFKPYVLSAAVQQGMNVQASILNASPYLCVAPDGSSGYSLPISAAAYFVDESTKSCALPGGYPVENDGGEIIGSAKAGYGVSPQTALAQSSNTAFTDLAHRVGTTNIIQMAGNFGVNLAPYSGGGSGLPSYQGEVGMALGIASLTVNEQTTMLSSIADNGTYHQAHLIKYWQLPDGPEQTPAVQTHTVLSPALDSQVQYAMENTTVNGTGTAAGVGLGNRQIIAKTGTTTNYHSGFFIGAIPQYSLVVGMFTSSQNTTSADNLAELGGGGFGGYWPAKIWNTFAQAEFANLPMESFQNPVFTGAKWNQVGNLPKPQKTQKKTNKKGGTPTPTSTPTQPGHGHGHGHNPSPSSTPTVTSSSPGGPSSTASATSTATPTVSGTASSLPTSLPTGGAGNGATTAATVSGVQAGLALGGVLSVLPGSLLWARASSRRRRRRSGGAG